MEDITDYLEDLPDIKMYEPWDCCFSLASWPACITPAMDAASDGRLHIKQKRPDGPEHFFDSLLPRKGRKPGEGSLHLLRRPGRMQCDASMTSLAAAAGARAAVRVEGGSDPEHESEGFVDSPQFGRVEAASVHAEALRIDDGDLLDQDARVAVVDRDRGPKARRSSAG
jgi:hypothetical protein